MFEKFLVKTIDIWLTHFMLIYFRGCNDYQVMYQELSAKVDKVAYNAAKSMMMRLYSLCNNADAWNPVNFENYTECTNEISNSSYKIQGNMDNIESFILNRCKNMSIQIELEQILEEVELDPEAPQGLEWTMAYIKNVSMTLNQYQSKG